MVLLEDLVRYLDELLLPGQVSDRAVNGLQVEGRREVNRLVLGVSASLALFEAAHRLKADALLVHHGLLFGSAPQAVTGLFRRRLAYLLNNDLSLLAYHLPLDVHPDLGHSMLLARSLGLEDIRPFGAYQKAFLGARGRLPSPLPPREVEERVHRICLGEHERQLSGPSGPPGRALFVFGPSLVQEVAMVSGGGAFMLEEALRQGVEMFITGEGAEGVHEICREMGAHFLAAGHGATESVGMRALASHLRQVLPLETESIWVANPF